MPIKETTCVDCGNKVLSTGKTKQRCPTCQDIHRVKVSNSRKRIRRKNEMTAKADNPRTIKINNDDTEPINEKQSLQTTSNRETS